MMDHMRLLTVRVDILVLHQHNFFLKEFIYDFSYCRNTCGKSNLDRTLWIGLDDCADYGYNVYTPK
jgi:hypothetical protein